MTDPSYKKDCFQTWGMCVMWGCARAHRPPTDEMLEPLIQRVEGGGRTWCPTLVIPALGRERQEER